MDSSTDENEFLLTSVRPLGVEFLECMRDHLLTLGLCLEAPSWDAAKLEIGRDEQGEDVVLGHWQSQNGLRVGGWVFDPKGEGFAEVEVFCRHPKRRHLFVESVCVFGKCGALKCEAKCRPLASLSRRKNSAGRTARAVA